MTTALRGVVVDTNVLSYVFKGDTRAVLYRPHLENRRLLVSFQTVAETDRWPIEGGWGERRRADLERFLADFAEVPHNRALSRRWAVAVAGRRRAGRPILAADAWIAATALELGLPLVSHNRRDFEGVDGLELVTEAP